MAWYLNRALTNFRAAVNAAYPNRDKASDGTIGDPAHQARDSDHNPDLDGSVDAWDMDVDLRSGDDPTEIEMLKRAFEAHESSRYWIHNRQVASRSDGWVRRYYSGDNAHDKHVHWNTRETYEDSNAPWDLGVDMALSPEDRDDIRTQVALGLYDALWVAANGKDYRGLKYTGPGAVGASIRANLGTLSSAPAVAEVAALRTVVESLASAIRAGGGTVDTTAILAGVDARLAAVRADMRDAVADLGEGGAAQVRAPQG